MGIDCLSGFWLNVYNWGKVVFITALLMFSDVLLPLGSRNNSSCGYVVLSMVSLKEQWLGSQRNPCHNMKSVTN